MVICEIEDCAHHIDGRCSKSIICIISKTFSAFDRGQREWSPTCEDYKEIDDDLSD